MNSNKLLKNTRLGAVVALVLVGTLLQPASAEVVYAIPAAPTITSVEPVNGGLKVTWTAPATTNPAITNFLLSAGAGACAVTVNGKARSAILPTLSKTETWVSLQAVNAYGISTADGWYGVTPTSTAAKSIKSVQVLQLSDFHGAVETTATNIGAAPLATMFKTDRANNAATVTVSSGDNFGASPVISSAFEELPTVEAMNAMQFDVSTFGNHEHDRDITHLKKMIEASNFKWVVSNYNTLEGLKASSTKFVSPYTIINRGGVKIGIVGANTAETKDVVFPGNLNYTLAGKTKEISISASTAGVNAAAAAARKAGADLVIAVVHEGWNTNIAGKATGGLIDYASKLKGINAIYGGHSHQQYSTVLNGVLTAQVINSGVQYTRSQICVDVNTNKVLGSTVEFVKKANVPAAIVPDVTAAEVVTKYKSQITAKFDVKIGTVSAVAARGGSPAIERSGEQPLGSYIADALLAKYKTDLVLINGGGIRDTFPAATYKPADQSLRRFTAGATGPFDVTLGDAYAVLPFGNSVSTTTVTGTKLWEALENGVSQYPSNGRWPQIAGFKFTVDTTKAVGSRITAVSLNNGTAIAKDDKVYTIATLDFMVYGGDGYTQFDPSKQRVRDLYVDVFVEALQRDLAAGKTTVMVADGRITVIK
jgi:5'-nucleotidase